MKHVTANFQNIMNYIALNCALKPFCCTQYHFCLACNKSTRTERELPAFITQYLYNCTVTTEFWKSPSCTITLPNDNGFETLIYLLATLLSVISCINQWKSMQDVIAINVHVSAIVFNTIRDIIEGVTKNIVGRLQRQITANNYDNNAKLTDTCACKILCTVEKIINNSWCYVI